MCWTYEGSYTDPNFRDGCDFLLYTEDELKEIIEMDREAERLWNPPPQLWRSYVRGLGKLELQSSHLPE